MHFFKPLFFVLSQSRGGSPKMPYCSFRRKLVNLFYFSLECLRGQKRCFEMCSRKKSLIRWLEGLGLKRKIKDKKTPPHYFMSFNDHLHIVEHRMINSKNANVMSDIPTQNPFKKSYFVI